MDEQTRTAPAIAIIGASVRGTSLLERVLASAPEFVGEPLQVHVVDPHPPGSGRIWRAEQSPHLVMNTVAAQSTVFTDATVACAGPIRPGPSLAEWCRLVAADPVADPGLPVEVREEASRTVDHSNPSRLLYGHYLRWCFAHITATAPASVDVRVHQARAVDLRPSPAGVPGIGGTADGDDAGGWAVHLDEGSTLRVDAVLLALGWLPRTDVPRHALVVGPDNPIDQDLSAIRAGDPVAVRGLGMGFFDTLSQLTEQRGGRFAQASGSLRYEPSGDEPTIIAGSSRGVPYRAKPDFGAPPFFPEQRILRAALPRLRDARPVDFTRDVLPLIERDAHVDYYRALETQHRGAVVDVDGLLRGLADGASDIEETVSRHVPDPAARLSLADAADPLRAEQTTDPDAAVADAVRRDAAEAALGLRSPLKLALHSYAAARGALIDLVAFGGLSPASFPAYRRYLAVAASFGSGPPLYRTRQLLALHAAGVVRFSGPLERIDVAPDGVTVVPHTGQRLRAARLIEAWLPTPTITHASDPLVRSLVDGGRARAWRFTDGIESDALEVRPQDGAVIGADGFPVPGLFSVGVPHEDIRVFTIIAPVPGTNSSVLRETDAAARAALVATARRRGSTLFDPHAAAVTMPGHRPSVRTASEAGAARTASTGRITP